jgi:hypothetical protein
MRPGKYSSYARILFLYLFLNILHNMGWWNYRQMIKASKGIKAAQKDWLMRAMKRRKGTAFGKDHGFDTMKSVEDFRSKIPVTEYDFYRPYAERVAGGEENVLDPAKTVYIILTSGTTGNNKKFPMSKAGFWELFMLAGSLPLYITSRKYRSSLTLKKMLMCFVFPNVVKNESGLRMGALSGCNEYDPGYCTPFYAIKEIKSEPVIMYIHAVFGLLHDDLEQIYFNFVTLARSFFMTLENHWQDIVEDIRTGTLSSDLDITPEMRSKLEKEMWANPTRAAELRQEFSKGFHNIIPRLWPQVHHISMISSGSLQTPSLTLQKKYFPGVPVWDMLHGASEGYYGVCVDPGKLVTTYTMLPHNAFYEFIPLEYMEKPDIKPKLIHEVRVDVNVRHVSPRCGVACLWFATEIGITSLRPRIPVATTTP